MFAILAVVAAGALALAVVFYVHYRIEYQAVCGFARNAVVDCRPMGNDTRVMDIAIELAAYIHFNLPRQSDDPPFLSRWLDPLGATPGTVLHVGGCCSGLARVLIVALDTLGIRAAQVTLNHRRLRYRHCVVEVSLKDGRGMLVDPKYGMVYHDQHGGLIGLEDLRCGIEPRFAPFPGRARAAYPKSEIYDWDYRKTGTANWVKSSPRRFAYRILHTITRGGIDVWRQPVLLEWPQLLLCAGCLGVGSLLFGIWAASRLVV